MNTKILTGITLILLTISCRQTGNEIPEYESPYFEGVSNKGLTSDKPYLTAGDRAYIIGLQDGSFPDMGGHVQGEMGGIWTLPIKLVDGYWLRVADVKTNKENWLMKADTFLNYPFGNQFNYQPVLEGIKISRSQYIPEGKSGAIIKYYFTNTSTVEQQISVDFVVKSDISPVWYSNENGIFDGPDTLVWNDKKHLFEGKDITNNWYAVWGTNHNVASYSTNISSPIETQGLGSVATINSVLELAPGGQDTISYFICGSTKSSEDAISVYTDISQNDADLFTQKKDMYKAILQRSRIELPDKKLEETYNWVKINTQWLVSDLPGIGRFLGAGAIEYPWLFGCDNSYAQQGVLASGDFELAKSTLRILKNVSEKANGNGRIIHEMSSNGFVGNKGNTQETAHYIVAAWQAFLWTGDIDFLKELYPYIKSGIQWLTNDMDTNKNLFPEGYGIMEVKGLNAELIDVSVYTQQALEAASEMALLFNEQELSIEYKTKADLLKEKINTAFWDEDESSYCDFYGTREQAISTVKGAIDQVKLNKEFCQTEAGQEKVHYYNSLLERFTKLPEKQQRGWFTNKNWVVNTPIETGIAPRDKAIRNLDKIRSENCGEYGPYLSAVEKDRMMTIATGVQAMSEARYGRTDEALWYVNCIANTLHRTLPGSINEMMPDYGCPAQAWTIYGVITPVITHIFGVTPNAYHKKVVFEPHLPSGWNHIKVSDLPIGTNIFSLEISKNDKETVYIISSKDEGWDCTLLLPGDSEKDYSINGEKKTTQDQKIQLLKKESTIIISNRNESLLLN